MRWSLVPTTCRKTSGSSLTDRWSFLAPSWDGWKKPTRATMTGDAWTRLTPFFGRPNRWRLRYSRAMQRSTEHSFLRCAAGPGPFMLFLNGVLDRLSTHNPKGPKKHDRLH